MHPVLADAVRLVQVRIREKRGHFCLSRMQCTCPVGCGAIARRMQFAWSISGPQRTSSAFLEESTQLLNRKELERVLYIQMEHLDERYLTVYQLHQSDERIKKITQICPLSMRGQCHRFRNFFKTVKNLEK